jgi:hypothetical protein
MVSVIRREKERLRIHSVTKTQIFDLPKSAFYLMKTQEERQSGIGNYDHKIVRQARPLRGGSGPGKKKVVWPLSKGRTGNAKRKETKQKASYARWPLAVSAKYI